MLSKSRIKWIRSLERKKNRDEQSLFIAEGIKIVSDLLPLLSCKYIAVRDDLWDNSWLNITDEIDIISAKDYEKISFQKSPQGIMAIFEKPKANFDLNKITNELCIALDDVQDPGNLGTIIRLADWFGIKHLFCSLHTADAFSPKTIQSTMGAIGRVNVYYVDLASLLAKLKGQIPVYGTFMDGDNIYEQALENRGIIVMGNEGNGISHTIEAFISKKLTIPGFSSEQTTSESLNVGIATAIVISEFRRRF